MPGIKVTPVDATAAGDTFDGAFLAEYLNTADAFAAARFASRHLYRQMLKSGVRIHEFQGRMMHAKCGVIDGAWATIGSYNLDVRSMFHNLEAGLLILDERFAANLERAMAELEGGSTGIAFSSGLAAIDAITDLLDVGVIRVALVEVKVGTIIDLALTPVGPTGDRADGSGGRAGRSRSSPLRC